MAEKESVEAVEEDQPLLKCPRTKRMMELEIHQYCPNIVSLYLPNVKLSWGSVLALAEFSGLQLLDLSYSITSNASANSQWNLKKTEKNLHTAFRSLSNLVSLKMVGCEIKGTCLKGVNRGKLKCLNISYCAFTSSGIDAFLGEEWPELKELVAVFFRIRGHSHEPFMDLLVGKVKKLQSLNVAYCPDDVFGNLEVLAELEDFREFGAEGIFADEVNISGFLEVLATNPESAGRLEFLDLYDTVLGPEIITLISNLGGLKELLLAPRQEELFMHELNCVNEETVFEVCRGCRKLERITMRGFPKLTDTCLASVGSYCSNLTYFDCVDSENITNQGLEALVNGLRSSGQHEREIKIEIYANQCRKVDVNSLQIHDSWVSVNVDDVPSTNLYAHKDLLFPSFDSGDEESSDSSYGDDGDGSDN